MHEDRREDSVDVADMDDEEFERIERQRELEDQRRKRDEAERAHQAAIDVAREQYPDAPSNAYDPRFEPD